MALARGASENFEVPLQYLHNGFSTQLGFANAHHKTTPKSGLGLGLRKLPYIWGSPLILLQRPRCPLSVSGASC